MCKVWGLKPNLESAWIWPGWLTNDLHCVSWSFLMWVLSFCLSPASWGRGLWPQWRRPGRRLRQGRVMSPSRLAWLELVWSGPVWFSSAWPASLLLWTNGKHGRPVTEILQKRHMRDTCSFSHLYGSHGDRKDKGGVRGFDSLEWTVSHVPAEENRRVCIFTQPPPADRRTEEPCVTDCFPVLPNLKLLQPFQITIFRIFCF